MKNLSIFLLIFFVSLNVFSKGMPIKVAVKVNADDVIKDQIENDINKSLRSYDDIDLVDRNNDPNYILSVIVIQTKNKNNDITGYACSVDVVMTLQDPINKVLNALETKKLIGPKAKKIFMNLFKDSCDFPVSSLLVDSDLANLIDRVVAFANTQAFEPLRKIGEPEREKLGLN